MWWILPTHLFTCYLWFLQQTATIPLYSLLRLVFLMEVHRVLSEVRSGSSLLRRLTAVFKRLMKLSRMAWLNDKWRRTWKKAVMTHASVQSQCLPRDTDELWNLVASHLSLYYWPTLEPGHFCYEADTSSKLARVTTVHYLRYIVTARPLNLGKDNLHLKEQYPCVTEEFNGN
jgi:hypothetical protein